MIGFSNVLEAAVTYPKPVTVNNNVTRITIPPYAYNNVSNLNIVGFPNLEVVDFGESSFQNIESLTIQNVNNLQSIQVGNSSMYSANKVTIQGMNDSYWLLNRSSSIREYFIRREWFVL